MQRNIRMIVAYDGAAFHGWQAQPGMRTVQQVLQEGIARVARHRVDLIGAGRTDSGVHALGQTANFLTDCTIPTNSLFRAIGSRIPKDVTIEDMREVPLTFHSQYCAVRKLYRYRIYADNRRPVGRLAQHYAYHYWHTLDLEQLQRAASVLVGEHDFSAFASKGNQRIHNIRRITRCDVSARGREIRIDVEGTGFVYNQVRNMVGTLLEIGRGHWALERMAEILASRQRSNAGNTAPAHGLTMQWVMYDMAALRAEEQQVLTEAPEKLIDPRPYWRSRYLGDRHVLKEPDAEDSE